MQIDSNHRASDIPFEKSPNTGGSLRAEKRRFIIIHYTAGRSLDAAVGRFSNPKSRVSAHLIIGRDGQMIQMVDFDTVAWHAGKSLWRGLRRFNHRSIGIELVNAGPLVISGGTPLTWWGQSVGSEDVVHVSPNEPGSFGKAAWMKFPEPQITACIDAVRSIADAYGITTVLGHADIAPGRKMDPGPAFPLFHLQQIVAGRDDDDDDAADRPASPSMPLYLSGNYRISIEKGEDSHG